MSKELTAERLRELLHYDPETGEFTRRTRGRGKHRRWVGYRGPGYIQIWVADSLHSAHRLAWLYVHSEWPDGQIDHRDGNGHNNAIANLRVCDHSQNGQNRLATKSNPRGLQGTSVCDSTGRFRAKIVVSRKQIHLGYFDTAEQAHQAYLSAKKQLHTFNPVPRTTTTGTSANDSQFTTPSRACGR